MKTVIILLALSMLLTLVPSNNKRVDRLNQQITNRENLIYQQQSQIEDLQYQLRSCKQLIGK